MLMTFSSANEKMVSNRSRSAEQKATVSVPLGICLGTLSGVAAQIAVITISALVLTKLDDPAIAFDACAVVSSAVGGLFGGRTAASKCPNVSSLMCGVGTAASMAALLAVFSCFFTPDIYTAWVPYTSLGVMALCSVFGAGKGRKKHSRVGKNAANRRKQH